MRYRLDDILAFIQVIETGSFSAAALRLNLAKSVVSKRVSDLEAALGGRLLHRSTRRVTPTDKGRAFYGRARTLLRELDAAAEEVSDDDEALIGPLRIAAPMSFGTLHLAPLLFAFAARHPRLELALDLDDRMVDLGGGGYDLAVRIGRLPDSALVGRRLAESRRVVCCSPDYAGRAGVPATLDELPHHEGIGYANIPAGQLWQFEPAAGDNEPRGVTMRCRAVANNGEAMRDAALAGLGVALLPLFIAAPALREGRLVAVLPGIRPLSDTIYAVYPPTSHPGRKVRAVIDHLVAALSGVPAWEAGLPPQVQPAGDAARRPRRED